MGQALLLAVLVTAFEVRCQGVDYSHHVDYQHFEGYHDYQEYQPQFASERVSTDATSIQSQLATEITKLERETKLEKRYQNFLKYEKIFLRLVASGSLALGRNILFQSTSTVAQGDDDEEDAPDNNESRSLRSKKLLRLLRRHERSRSSRHWSSQFRSSDSRRATFYGAGWISPAGDWKSAPASGLCRSHRCGNSKFRRILRASNIVRGDQQS